MTDSQDIPPGLCQCGCGEKTNVPSVTNEGVGMVAGRPMRFVHGHHMKLKKADIRVEDRGHDTPCWMSQQEEGENNYCRLRDASGRQQQAHRLYYERFVGPIPDGHQIDHLCRNKLCVNPDHLEPVTAAENSRRANAKLTVEKVREIRASAETSVVLAQRYGVAPTTIKSIKQGRSWVGV